MEHFGLEYQDDEEDDDAALQYIIEESMKESNKQETEKESERHGCSHGCTADLCSTGIFTAIREGDEKTVRHLSAEKKDRFRETDGRGWTPLHQAAAQTNQTILELTFRATGKAAIESSSLIGQTPLCVAVEHGLLENASFLLQQGANPDSQNLELDTPLVIAIRSNRKDLLDLLLQHGSRVNQRGVHHRCPLHEAAQLGSIEMVEALLKAKADPDPRSAYGLTPLALAAQKGHLQVVDTLLRRGADVLSQAEDEASILFEAADACDPDVIALLLSYGADANIPKVTGHLPILRAAHRGNLEALQLLIPVTSDEAVNDTGMSPLHSAAAGGHTLCIQALLEAGYDPNDVLHPCVRRNYDDERQSVLYFAVSNNDAASARVLLEAGAMPNLDPIKCLQVALCHGNYEVINLLLRHGANVNYYCKVNTTHFPSALQYALNNEVILRMLCNYGYDVERCFDCPYGDRSHIPDDFEGWSDTIIKDNMFCEVISVSFLRHVAGPVVRVMLDYVSRHVTFCSMLKPVLAESEQWPDICRMQDNVRCLQHLCRVRIRQCLGRLRLRAPVFMSFLPLPPRLKDYILYKEYDLYGQQGQTARPQTIYGSGSRKC